MISATPTATVTIGRYFSIDRASGVTTTPNRPKTATKPTVMPAANRTARSIAARVAR